jgi:hypothetical protein
MESMLRGFRKRTISEDGKSLKIYLEKQDKVRRYRKGKEKHLVLDMQETRVKMTQNGGSCSGMFILS